MSTFSPASVIHRAALLAVVASWLCARPSQAQTCRTQANFVACTDAVRGAPADAGTSATVVDDIFRTTDDPPRYAPSLLFGRVVQDASVFNSTACNAGYSAFVAGSDPRRPTSWVCQNGFLVSERAAFVESLDWRWAESIRVLPDGMLAVDRSDCGGNTTTCGMDAPWLSGITFDLRGRANRAVLFPTAHRRVDPCLEPYAFTVWFTDDPAARSVTARGLPPDPTKWNRAALSGVFVRGWTNNALSTGTREDVMVHRVTDGADTADEALADAPATIWSLPCGAAFRYVRVIAGNAGAPDARCTLYADRHALDAVAGLDALGRALCPDVDQDGFTAASCGGGDCDDTNAAIHPGAAETCSDTADRDCDGAPTRCASGTGCLGGQCFARCGSANVRCADGFACRPVLGLGSLCMPTPCPAGVSCPRNQVCGLTGCQDVCTGVVCPYPQQCRAGACVDPCGGVTCPQGTLCTEGHCVPHCTCGGCAAGTSCEAATGRCVGVCDRPGCFGMAGAAGPADGGRYVDACDGVVCPPGRVCDVTTRGCRVDPCWGVSCAPGYQCNAGTCEPIPRDDGPEPTLDAQTPGPDAVALSDAMPGMDVSLPDAGAAEDAAGTDTGTDATGEGGRLLAAGGGGWQCAARPGDGSHARGSLWLTALALALAGTIRRARPHARR